MIDAAILPLQRSILTPIASALAARGIRADQITLSGFGIGLLACAALCFGQFTLGLTLILLNRLCDGLDGAVARLTEPTDRGAFLDIALDFVFYALVPLCFAFQDPAQNALPAALLITAFIGTGSSFLAFSVIAEKRGISAKDYPNKGIHYLGGLTEGFETIVFFILISLFPEYFPLLANIFAAACMITTLTRWHQGWIVFAPNSRPYHRKD